MFDHIEENPHLVCACNFPIWDKDDYVIYGLFIELHISSN